MLDLCPKGIDLGVKPSAPSCPPTLPLYLGLQTEQIKSQRNPPLPRRVAFVSMETQTEIQTVLVSVEIQTEIQTAYLEVQTTPVSVRLQTTLVSIETQTVEVRNEMEDRRQKEKRKTDFSNLSMDHMRRAPRETEEQPHKLLPLHEAPTRRNNQSMRVNKPFSYQEIQRIKEDLGDYLEDPEKYIRAFKGVTLLYDLTWKDVMYILGQTPSADLKT